MNTHIPGPQLTASPTYFSHILHVCCGISQGIPYRSPGAKREIPPRARSGRALSSMLNVCFVCLQAHLRLRRRSVSGEPANPGTSQRPGGEERGACIGTPSGCVRPEPSGPDSPCIPLTQNDKRQPKPIRENLFCPFLLFSLPLLSLVSCMLEALVPALQIAQKSRNSKGGGGSGGGGVAT